MTETNSETSEEFEKLAHIFLNGDAPHARQEWITRAKSGDDYAQYIVGVMFQGGDGVQQDYKIG